MLNRVKTGVLILDMLSMGGFPRASNVLILGAPGVGKSVLCRQIICEGLKAGGSGIYVTLDEPEEEILRFMKDMNPEVERFLEDGRLMILESHPSGLTDLNSLSIRLTSALKRLGDGLNVNLVIDSLTSILSLNTSDLKSCVEFIRALSYKVKGFKASCFYNLNSHGFDEKTIALVEGLMDGVVEMKMEEGEFPRFYIRILKLKSAVHSRRWVRYRIDQRLGVIPYIPTVVLTGPKGAGKKTLQRFFPSGRWRMGEVEVDVIVHDSSPRMIEAMRYKEIDGLLMILDSSDIESLTSFLELFERVYNPKTPTVILANKQDKPRALTPENLREELEIPPEIPVIGISAITGRGLEKALRTLTVKILGPPI